MPRPDFSRNLRSSFAALGGFLGVAVRTLIGLGVLGASAPMAGAASAAAVTFDIPAQSASAALLAFSKQAKNEILFPFDELQNVRSTAVVGSFTPKAALDRLLRGTGFAARANGAGRFVVTATTRPTGSITGTLLDLEGNPVAGVRVAVRRTRYATTTDSDGVFELASLPPGNYRLVAVADLYQPLHIVEVRVVANQVVQLDTQRLRPADEVTQLAPYVVKGQSGRRNWRSFDDVNGNLGPRAAGNLDLVRTEDDALPYTIYHRDQIARSGAVSLNEFLQRELLDSNAASRPPEQDASDQSLFAGSTNLSLRGYAPDETIVLVNGRRLPEMLASGFGASAQSPDVNFIPLSLVQQVQVLPVSAAALYSGNAVGGVINIVLRPDVDANASELTTTYTNALRGFDAPHTSVSLLHGRSLLGGRLRVRLNANFTLAEPATEAELGFRQARARLPVPLEDAVYRATPNIRSVDGMPLFGPGTATVTSVAPGADGSGGLAAFAGREGVRNFHFFEGPGGLTASLNSRGHPYGRRQQRMAYFGSAVYDVFPWLQLGVDATHARTVINRGYDVLFADLTLAAGSPFNPFAQEVRVSLNETAPFLGPRHGEARIEASSIVGGILLKLPAQWRVALDAQYARNLARYRGLAGADLERWQQLVDQGRYNPLRDTQAHGPSSEFYDEVLIYRGARGRFVTVGDYDTLDLAVRATNDSLPLPTGRGVLNLGVDYRSNHLGRYTDERRFADGSLAVEPLRWSGRTIQRYSAFGELQAPIVPHRWLPSWMRQAQAELAVRYVAADTAREANVAPTVGVKVDFEGGLAVRGSFTTSNRFPTPHMSRQIVTPSAGSGSGVDPVLIFDPVRNQSYDVEEVALLNPDLRPEAAVTQTAGLVFQRGEVHRLRVSLDFVDTRKTNELIPLDPQAVMNLERLLPERVRRAPLPPGDARPAGVVTSVFTGTTNLASRHSQNWNAALHYGWAGCFGGTLEVHGRLVYFQRYDRRILPGTPVVDELSKPGGTAPQLLRYRSSFGAGWSGRRLGFGMDGQYFHSRVLPEVERPSQGRRTIAPHWQFDAYVQGDLSRWLPWQSQRYGLRGQLRVNNVLGADFPRYANEPSGAGVQPYGDWRGRVVSVSLTATF